MFDLPVVQVKDRREYTKFRKFLIKEGFIEMQESIYCKMVATPANADLAKNKLYFHRPPRGLVQVLCITEKQYSSIEYIVGGPQTNIIIWKVLLFCDFKKYLLHRGSTLTR